MSPAGHDPFDWTEFDALLRRLPADVRERAEDLVMQAYDPDHAVRLVREQYGSLFTPAAAGRGDAPTMPSATAAERRERTRPGPVNAKTEYSLTAGFFKVPNDVADHLLAVMPLPVLKAYLYVLRLADVTGVFWISYPTLAEKIGCKDARYTRRVIDRLREAGLVQLVSRGARGYGANTYQLMPLAGLDLHRVREILQQPITPKRTKAAPDPGRSDHRLNGVADATRRWSQRPYYSDLTTQTST